MREYLEEEEKTGAIYHNIGRLFTIKTLPLELFFDSITR